MQLVLTVGGYVVGGYFGAPGLGAFVGATIGGYIDRKWLFPLDPIEGPRLDDLRIQISTYGAPINQLWGAMRMAGNMIWAAPMREVKQDEEIGGGCFAPGVTETVYSYFGTFAVGLCAGPIARVLKIWADTKLVFSVLEDNDKVVQIDGLRFRVYLGTETQLADPSIEEQEGAGEVPGFRSLAYIVFDDLPLETFGNRIPNFSFLVATEVTDAVPYIALDNITALVWGTDDLVFFPAGLYFLTQSAGYWDMLSTLTNEVVIHKEHLRAGGQPNIPDTGCDYDIDENGDIYSSMYDAGFMQSQLVRLSGYTLEAGLGSGWTMVSPWRIRVSRTAKWPVLAAITSGGTSLNLTDREWFRWGTLSYYESHTPPAGTNFMMVDFDNETGTIWAVCKDWNDLVTDTYVIKIMPVIGGHSISAQFDITSDIELGETIMYDADTNQVIIGSHNHDGAGNQGLAYYDATTMSLIAIQTGEVLSAWSKSSWRRGPVNGYLHFVFALNEVHRINIVDHTLDRTWYAWPSPGNAWGGNIYDPLTQSIITGVLGDGFNFAKILLDRATPDTIALSTIVTDICARVSLPAGEIDVTALTDLVKGYVINGQMSGRSAIQPLMDAFFFDGVESDGKLVFPKRGGSSVASIAENELATHPEGAERPQELITNRVQETELPLQVEVAYVDAAAHYDTGTQRARRLTTSSDERAMVRLPISLDQDEAMQIALKTLANIWMERMRHAITIPRKYSWLDVADIITVTEDSNVHTLRIEQLEYAGGIIRANLVNDSASVYSSDATGTPLPTIEQNVFYPGPTRLELLDLPLLRSTHNQPGLYMATQAVLDTWTGAVIYKSSDGGASWSTWKASVRDAVVGRATEVLPDVADPWVWDEGNTINIRLLDAGDTLSSATKAQVLDLANVAVLGDEIIQWRTATLQSDDSYTLSGLLRARMGTEWATGTHAVGDRFIVLDDSKIHFVPFPIEDMDIERYYQAVSLGLRFASGTAQAFTCEIRNMMPLSPQHVAGARDGSNNLTITWIRRTRYGGEWRDNGDALLGETTEAYEVDIMSGSTVVRAITGLSAESATYTAAEQTTDGLTPGDPITVNIYQISATVGRGFVTEATV